MYTLDDPGTRYQHYVELLELWEAGLEIIQRREPENDVERLRTAQLAGACFILRRHLDTLADYSSKDWRLRRKIEDAHAYVANSPVIVPEKDK